MKFLILYRALTEQSIDWEIRIVRSKSRNNAQAHFRSGQNNYKKRNTVEKWTKLECYWILWIKQFNLPRLSPVAGINEFIWMKKSLLKITRLEFWVRKIWPAAGWGVNPLVFFHASYWTVFGAFSPSRFPILNVILSNLFCSFMNSPTS